MMKQATLLLVGAALALSGCGKKSDTEVKSKPSIKNSIAITPAQKAAKAYITEMDKMVSALEAVTDAKSAEKAAAQIKKINARIETLSKKYDNQGTQINMAVVMMNNQQEFMAIQTRMSAAMMNLATGDPALMKTMTDAMSETPKLK